MSRGLFRTGTGALILTVLAGIGSANADVEVNEDVLNRLGAGNGAVATPLPGSQGGSVYGGAVSRTPLPFNRADDQDRYTVPSVLPLRPYSGPRRGGIKLRRPGSGPALARPTAPARPAQKPVKQDDAEARVAAAPVAPVRRQPDPEPAKPVRAPEPAAEKPLTAPEVVTERPATPRDVAPEPPRRVSTDNTGEQLAARTPSTRVPAPAVPELAEKPAPISDTAEMTRIVFDETSSELPDGYQDVIAAMASNIKDGSTARVQIHSYAFAENETLLWARRMAQRRAIIVRKVLRDEGITANRIAVRTDIDPDDDGPRNRVDLTIIPPR